MSIYTPGFFLYLQVKMSADDITRVDVTVTSKQCVINFNKLVEQKILKHREESTKCKSTLAVIKMLLETRTPEEAKDEILNHLENIPREETCVIPQLSVTFPEVKTN